MQDYLRTVGLPDAQREALLQVGYAPSQIDGAVRKLIDANPYEFSGKVGDLLVGVAKASAIFSTIAQEAPPIADAGVDEIARQESRMTLRGEGLSLAGRDVQFAWRQTGGPAVQLAGEARQKRRSLGPTLVSTHSNWL